MFGSTQEIIAQSSLQIKILPQDRVTYIRVDEDCAGQRLDNYLTRLAKGVPKSHLYRIIRQGEVRLNRSRTQPDAKLALGDIVRVPPMRVSQRAATQSVAKAPKLAAGSLAILYEDRDLLVVNKPAGLASHGGSGVAHGLIERLRSTRSDCPFLELCHRLDRETSGALIVAKTRKALVRMHDLMKNGGVEKHYYALVKGNWLNDRQHVKLPLERYLLPSGERRVRVSADGLSAHSIFTVLSRFRVATLLDVELKTGRTHQIRVHATSQGFPLVGDDKYGDFELNRLVSQGQWPGGPLKRMFLHAHTLKLLHPVTHAPLCIEAPLMPELQNVLNELQRQA